MPASPGKSLGQADRRRVVNSQCIILVLDDKSSMRRQPQSDSSHRVILDRRARPTATMKRHQEPSTQDVLAGLVERVTFHNADSGFCVLRIKARSHRDLVTVVGHAATIAPGEWVTASGDWVNDRTHGQQFKARFMRTSAPTSIDGIEKYLGSGMIRGIGPVYAKKMVKAWRASRPRRRRGLPAPCRIAD